MPVRMWQGEPSGHDANLAPVRGEAEGRRAEEEDPPTIAQFQECLIVTVRTVWRREEALEPKASPQDILCPVLHTAPATLCDWLGVGVVGDVVVDSEEQRRGSLRSPQPDTRRMRFYGHHRWSTSGRL